MAGGKTPGGVEYCTSVPYSKKERPSRYATIIGKLHYLTKILAYCLLDRIKPIAEEIIGDYQGGFRSNRSTTDQIFVIRKTLPKTWDFNKDVYILFVDFKKVYDSIHRASLSNILREFKFPKKAS